MKKCISEPISWLRLEQRALGELSDSVRRETEDHLRACEACREAAAQIAVADMGGARTSKGAPGRTAQRVPSPWRSMVAASGIFAAAAIVVLYVVRAPQETAERAKGSSVALQALVEARSDGSIPPAARTKLLVTCAKGTEGPWDIAVIENGSVSFPLEPAATFVCGNEVPYPAALILTGEATMDVCIVHGKAANRTLMLTPEELRRVGACTSVTPNKSSSPL